VVAPVRALLQSDASPLLGSLEITVGVTDHIGIDDLLASCVEAGYLDVRMVEEPGTFARRGGVVDVFPAGAELPVRLDFFGNEVESLSTFDISSQRSRGTVDRFTLMPVAPLTTATRESALEELLALDTSGLNAEATSAWLNDLSRLESGASLDELGLLSPYLLRGSVSLAYHLPSEAIIVMDDPDECRSVMAELIEQSNDVLQALQEAGDLPGGLLPPLANHEDVIDRLTRQSLIELHRGSAPSPAEVDLSGLFTPAPLYGGRVRAFVGDVEDTPSQRVVITSFQHERVKELLDEARVQARYLEQLAFEPLPGVTLLPGSLGEGWRLPEADVMVLTDHELFGRSRQRAVPQRRRHARETFFADFSPGDYVVHVEHGIGRFDGVTHMTIDGAEREYAVVQYAGTDRLYVPSDQLERLTRYVGVGDAAPPLNKLGGGEWQRARQRAKQAAEDIAKELIDIYAKRMARPGHDFAPDTPWQQELESSFPYPETPDQLRAVDEVKADMEQARPMDRLVCADVGYGKTEVAVRAAFKAVLDGRQVAVLVPTTILAQQHFETFAERFSAFPIRLEVMSRFRTPPQQRDILRRLALGEVDVVIGTHRLLGKDVKFHNLGLLVVDEEQRFGVKHKEQLKRLRETMDVLTLTATPIPRTLHMGLVGIREISVIETPPEGRLPIKTHLQPFEERLIREAVIRELDRDGQVYIVHNKVSSIEAMAERVRRLVPEARVVVGHGQMDEAQLEWVMLSFARGQADVLVSSTIIENGLDIPNVNTIMVNHAELLGLTQLYQLRGRVGRGANQAYAYLLYPRDVRLSRDALRRMEAVFEAHELGSGFNIAMKDLEIRGAGNLLGAEQSGNATAVGFDLFTRMISDAVEKQRGAPVPERPLVTVDLPLTMFLPAAYVGSETERLMLYRRLAGVATSADLRGLQEEMVDRFGALPVEVENLVTSVHIKLLAGAAHVIMVSLAGDTLTLRTGPRGLYDRVSLYRDYAAEAKIATNVLRIPRRRLPEDWIATIIGILEDMIRLRQTVQQPQAVGV